MQASWIVTDYHKKSISAVEVYLTMRSSRSFWSSFDAASLLVTTICVNFYE